MDFMSLQGATIGSFGLGKPFLCNGANFAYEKKFFQELNGFSGNASIASGDDVFLLQKAVAKSRKQVHYLKSREAIVITKPAGSWLELFYQRVRWASKASSYSSDFGEALSWIVFLGNLSLVFLFGLAIAELFEWKIVSVMFLLKFVVDYILMLLANGFLNKSRFIFPLFSSILYPFFSVAAAVYSAFGKYEWKGRKH